MNSVLDVLHGIKKMVFAIHGGASACRVACSVSPGSDWADTGGSQLSSLEVALARIDPVRPFSICSPTDTSSCSGILLELEILALSFGNLGCPVSEGKADHSLRPKHF